MKKIIFSIMAVFIFLLTGCTNEIDKLITTESDVKIENSNVTLKVREETLTNKGATFVLENNRRDIIDYTLAYEI